jgi:hypothetical protein
MQCRSSFTFGGSINENMPNVDLEYASEGRHGPATTVMNFFWSQFVCTHQPHAVQQAARTGKSPYK